MIVFLSFVLRRPCRKERGNNEVHSLQSRSEFAFLGPDGEIDETVVRARTRADQTPPLNDARAPLSQAPVPRGLIESHPRSFQQPLLIQGRPVRTAQGDRLYERGAAVDKWQKPDPDDARSLTFMKLRDEPVLDDQFSEKELERAYKLKVILCGIKRLSSLASERPWEFATAMPASWRSFQSFCKAKAAEKAQPKPKPAVQERCDVCGCPARAAGIKGLCDNADCFGTFVRQRQPPQTAAQALAQASAHAEASAAIKKGRAARREAAKPPPGPSLDHRHTGKARSSRESGFEQPFSASATSPLRACACLTSTVCVASISTPPPPVQPLPRPLFPCPSIPQDFKCLKAGVLDVVEGNPALREGLGFRV